GLLTVLCVIAVAPGDSFAVMLARPQATQIPAGTEAAPRIPSDQLDSLVAPIALYPDALLAQTLAASTYPLELMQLHQWMARKPGLTDKALPHDAVQRHR